MFKAADGGMEFLSSLQAFIWLGVGQGSRNAVCQPQDESPTTKVGLQRPIQYRHAAVFLLQNMGLRAQ